MSAWECLQRALLDRAGETGFLREILQELTGTVSIDLEALLKADYAAGTPGMPPQMTVKMLSDAIKETEEVAAQRVRALTIAAIVQGKLAQRFDIAENANVAGRKILRGMLAPDWSGDIYGPSTNYAMGAKAARASLLTHITDFLDRQNKTEWKPGEVLSRDVLKEAHGQSSGNADAASLMGAFSSMMEEARLRANAAGAWIKKLDNYFPQAPDAQRMHAKFKDNANAFADWALAEIDLDWARIAASAGSKAQYINKRKFLMEYYTDVVKNKNTIAPLGTNPLPKSVADPGRSRTFVETIGTARHLFFANGDAWFKFHDEIGTTADIVTIMHTWVNDAASKIAILETFGPDPDGTANALLWKMKAHDQRRADKAKSERARKQALQDARTGNPGAEIRNLWADMQGRATVQENISQGTWFANVRQIGIGGMLGSIIFMALTDIVPSAFAAKVGGLPVARVVMRQLFEFPQALVSFADRKAALEMGWTTEVAQASLINAARFSGEVQGSKWARGFSEWVMRKGAIITWNEHVRTVYSTEFAFNITRQLSKSWDKIDSDTRNMFERHGITKQDWVVVQKATPSTMANGAKMFTPADIMAMAPTGVDMIDPRYRAYRDIANKFQQMVAQETHRAIPTPDARVRAALMGGSMPGTWEGELRRSAAFLKTFPVTIVMHQLTGMFFDERLFGSVPSRIATVAAYSAAMTIMAGVGMTLGGLTKGKGPPDYDPTTDEGLKFWTQAAIVGGSFGFFGDMVAQTGQRGPTGPLEYAAGPILTAATKLAYAPVAAAQSDEPFQEGTARAFRALKGFMPGQSLWWGTLAYQRLITDNITKLVEPHPDRVFRKQERYAREQGQDYYWAPGELLP